MFIQPVKVHALYSFPFSFTSSENLPCRLCWLFFQTDTNDSVSVFYSVKRKCFQTVFEPKLIKNNFVLYINTVINWVLNAGNIADI